MNRRQILQLPIKIFVSTLTTRLGLYTSKHTGNDSEWSQAAGIFRGNSLFVSYLNHQDKVVTEVIRSLPKIDYCWIAMWDTALTEGEIQFLASGIDPLYIRPENLVKYFPPVASF